MNFVNTQSSHEESRYIMNIFEKIVAALQGNLTLIWFWSALIGFLAPVAYFILLVFGLVITDTISGVFAAIRLKTPLESRKAYRTLIKIVVYSMAILAAHGINLVLITPMQLDWLGNFSLVQIASGSIVFTEFLSLRENILKLTDTDILGGFKKAITVFSTANPDKKEG